MDLHDRLRHALREAGLTQGGSSRLPTDTPRPRTGALPGGRAEDNRWNENRGQESGPSGPGIEAFLPGFWQDTSAGRVFVVERHYELDYQHGGYRIGSVLDVPPDLLARIGRQSALAGVDHRQIVYLDTETTGLAGGTGTLAFLVGVGHFVDGSFRLRQYFLDSLDREEALLRALSDYLDPFAAVASFNGKVFDVPLLETRLILSRLRRDVRALPHLDLLFAARRMYRDRFDSCRLGEIERRVLGLTRSEDVPSFEVPSLYFRYVRYRRFRALIPVFDHNALDILSLATLTAHFGRLYRGELPLDSEDELALARDCEHQGYVEEALCHYQAVLHRSTALQRDDAERRLAALYKRLGRWEEAAALWQRAAERPENRSVLPLTQLAMYYERRRGDLATALVHAQNALSLLRRHHLRLAAGGAVRHEVLLERRVTRLRRRLDRVVSGGRRDQCAAIAGETAEITQGA